MKHEELKRLERGDIVKHVGDPTVYVVTANYGERVTATSTVDITNPPEWEIVLKVEHRPWVQGGEIRVGDVVTLKSGSPPMTVVDISTGMPLTVACCWFVNDELKNGIFDPECLQRS